jgi:hypothetical protein
MIGAFQHILEGQDPNHSSPQAREDRTFAAYETSLLLWRFQQENLGAARAIQESAGTYNADIIVVSWGPTPGNCDTVDVDYPELRDAWDYAYSHGAIGVLAAGNLVWRYSDQCSANGWATHNQLLVVGAFGLNEGNAQSINYDTAHLMGSEQTDMAGSNNCPSLPPGTACPRSATGDARIRVINYGVQADRGIIDLVGPAGAQHYARVIVDGSTVNSFYQFDYCCGTSFAAPLVASAMVSPLDWARANGHGGWNTPAVLHTNMLLMGDGARGDAGPYQSTYSYSQMDRDWGAGRLKIRRLTSHDLTPNWGWGWDQRWIGQGQVVDVPVGGAPLPTDVDRFTVAMSWDEPNITPSTYDYASDIVLTVVTTAPSGGACVNPNGGAATWIRDDWSFDPQKLIRIQGSQIDQLRGRCVWMRITGVSLPYGARLVTRADYWENWSDRPWLSIE